MYIISSLAKFPYSFKRMLLKLKEKYSKHNLIFLQQKKEYFSGETCGNLEYGIT